MPISRAISISNTPDAASISPADERPIPTSLDNWPIPLVARRKSKPAVPRLLPEHEPLEGQIYELFTEKLAVVQELNAGWFDRDEGAALVDSAEQAPFQVVPRARLWLARALFAFAMSCVLGLLAFELYLYFGARAFHG